MPHLRGARDMIEVERINTPNENGQLRLKLMLSGAPVDEVDLVHQGRAAIDDLAARWSIEHALGLDQIAEHIERAVHGERCSSAASNERSRLLARSLAEVRPKELRWLWPGKLPLGKLVMYAGDPGLGKSMTTLDMAARVSTGMPWPDGNEIGEPGTVILLSAEDSAEDIILPRLINAQADPNKIIVAADVEISSEDGTVHRAFSLETHVQELRALVEEHPDTRLIIIDPITAYTGRTDSHKNAEIRGLLSPLADMAEEMGVTILAVSHLNKGQGEAIYRTMGSLAFVAAARAAWACVKDKDDPERRMFLPVKNNYAPDVTGLAFRIVDQGSGPVVAWERDALEVDVNDALRRDDGHTRSEVHDCADWLEGALADEPLEAKAVKRMATENGFSFGTLRRAKDRLGVEAEKDGFGAEGRWIWSLPEGAHDPRCSTPTSSGLRTLGEAAHLRRNGPENDDESPQISGELPNPPKGAQAVGTGIIADGGLVPHGWTRERYIADLHRRASTCEKTNPDKAAELRGQAAVIADGAERSQ